MELQVLLFLCLCVVVTFAKPPDTLRMVHYLFRHGDRSPVRSYKGDPNDPKTTWPKGFGQLTKVGMRQHYKLGRYFRKRYDGFISRTYYNREVHVRSTDVDRTLMSAYSHLAGLYPPVKNDTWNQALDWQPIPVHTVPSKLDFVLKCDDCPKKEVLRKNVFNLPYFRAVEKEERPFLDWLSEKFGTHYDLSNAYIVQDPLFIEHLKGLPIPDFINQTVLDKLRYLDMITFKADTYTTGLQRISGGSGPLVNDLIERIKLKISGKLDPDLKLYIYSAHDSTVSAFLHAIQSFNDKSPPYTATVIMELHEVGSQYYLQFSYKNETDHEPYDIVVPGCSLKCPFDKFVELTRPVISDDVQKECQLAPQAADGQHIQVVVFASVAVVSVVIVGLQVIVIVMLRKRNHRDFVYSRVDMNM